MTVSNSFRMSWMPFILLLLLGIFPTHKSLAYIIEAEILDPNAMMFPVGRLLPEDFTDASDINFRSIQPIFKMRVFDDSTHHPDMLVLMVRLEVHGGEPIFTVNSNEFDIPRWLVQPYNGRWLNNQQLADAPGFTIGEGQQVNKNRLAPYISGQNMTEGMYVLTVLLARANVSWETAVQGDNYGIVSETMQIYNPSQVILTEPEDNGTIVGNPRFSWNCVRNPGVSFHFELVGHVVLQATEDWIVGEEYIDPSTALDFANEYTRFLDINISLGPDARGDYTEFTYGSRGDERQLEKGRTYFWRVTGLIPSLISGQTVEVESSPFTFSYGPTAEILGPNNQDEMEINPTFLWVFPPLGDLQFQIIVVKGDFENGTHWSTIDIDAGGLEREQWSHTYGTGFNERALEPGMYSWQIIATYAAEGEEKTTESIVREFTFSPPLELLAPLDTVSTSRPTFVWSFPYSVPVANFLLEVLEDDEIFTSIDVASIQRSIPLNRSLDMGFDYQWRIKAVTSDDYEMESDLADFHFARPDLVLQEPLSNGVIFNETPLFRWGWTSPLQVESSASYSIAVSQMLSESDSVVFADVDLQGSPTSWTYSGDSLQAGDYIYKWQIEARVTLPSNREFTQVRANTFTYQTDPEVVQPILTLLEPEDDDVLEITPVFRWSFSQLPEDYHLEFQLTVIPDSADATPEIIELEGDQREYTYDSEALTESTSYKWHVLAGYGPSEEPPLEEISSDTLTFTYQPSEREAMEEDELRSRLLSAMHGNLPPEMLDMIIEALQSDLVEISAITIDGSEATFEELLSLIEQVDIDIEVVLIHISQ